MRFSLAFGEGLGFWILGGIMKNILKTKYISFLLALVMVVGIFLPCGGALADGGKYSIELQIDVKDKEDYSKHDFKKDSLVIKPSGRQVKVYKLNIEGDLSSDQMVELAAKYDKYTAEDFKKLKDEKKIDEGFLSGKSKLKYGKTTYDEIDTSKIKDFDYSKLSEEILIKELAAGYYLIKETDESAKILKEKLATNVVKLPSKKMNNNVHLIIAKQVKKVKTKQIKLIKVDADNKDIRLSKVKFKLFQKIKDGDKVKDVPVKVTGEKGNYFRDDEKGAAIELETWDKGEIVVNNLLDGTYYFKETEPAPGYDQANVGKISDDLKPGDPAYEFKNKMTPILRKVNADKKDEYLKEAVFKVFTEDNKVLKFKKTGIYYEQDANGKEEIETDSNGAIYISDLKPGKYFLEEIKAPKGYILSSNKIEIKIKDFRYYNEEGKLDVKIVENKPETPTTPKTPTGGFNFVKIDSTKDENRLGGAKFILMKKVGSNFEKYLVNGKEIKLTSKDNGEFSIDGLEYGEYALKEVEAPENHTIVNDLTPFTVDAASSSLPAKKIVNEPYTPRTIVSKTNTITTKYTPNEITRIVKTPLVKTGDIRIVVMAIVGLILLMMGIKLVNSTERVLRI